MDRNSMLYWWPLVKDIDVPQPKTAVAELVTVTGISLTVLRDKIRGILNVTGYSGR